jgi:hypothetical protein
MYPSPTTDFFFQIYPQPTKLQTAQRMKFHFLVSSFDEVQITWVQWFPRGWKDVDRELNCSCRWRNRSQPFIFPDWELGLGFGDGGSVFVKKEMKNEGFISTRARGLVFFSVAVIASRHTRKLRSASARSWEKPARSFTMRAKVWLPLLLPICCYLSVSLLLSSSVWKLWDRVPRRVFEVCVWCVWFDRVDLRFLLSLCGSVFFFCIWVALSA